MFVSLEPDPDPDGVEPPIVRKFSSAEFYVVAGYHDREKLRLEHLNPVPDPARSESDITFASLVRAILRGIPQMRVTSLDDASR